MKKWSICKLVVILILSIQNRVGAQKIELLKTTVLDHFPSASSLEFHKNKLYVIGDDARDMWVLDNQHGFIDSFILFKSVEARISKEEKADFEASTIVNKQLVSFSSLSTDQRNKLLMFNLKTSKTKIKDYRLENIAIPETNIEGAAMVGDHLVLANRANNTTKKNYLVITKIDKHKIKHKSATVTLLQLPENKNIIGISGLTYVKEKDVLLFTASTENTSSAYSDGEIGDSYLGYLPNISTRLKEKEIVAENLISLKKLLSNKAPQKIEAVTVEQIEGNIMTIHLAADNDNGKSTLFKAQLTLPNL